MTRFTITKDHQISSLSAYYFTIQTVELLFVILNNIGCIIYIYITRKEKTKKAANINFTKDHKVGVDKNNKN